MACSENRNPLQRGGTNQQHRMLAALEKDYVNIDERDYADWIVFASEFAAYLNYYNTTDTLSGNWKPFFENDISAVLGTVAIQSIDEYRRHISERFSILKAAGSASNITAKKEALGGAFAAVLTLCQALDNKIVVLREEVPLKSTIQNLVRVKLQPVLHRLLTYYKAGKALSLIKEKDYPEWKILGFPVLKASLRITGGLSPLWMKNADNWEDYYNDIIGDPSIYGDLSWDNHRLINHAANHNLFSGLFDQFLLAYSKIITDAEGSLLKTLSSWSGHLPHYALFLSFLKLFRFARDHANTITQRHLDFYYKETLRLFPKKARPNKAHIIVELAKQASTYLIAKDILFKAGKDSLGKEVNYAMERDVVFNKAKISSLLTVYKGSSKDNLSGITNQGRLFASAVTNSKDGLGAALDSSMKEWHPFVSKKYTDGALTAIRMPKATLGFALASHYLYLTEGERVVNIKFASAFTADQQEALTRSECYLTSEKGWLKVSAISWTSGTISGTTSSASVLTFTLAGDVPAISNYDVTVHGGTFKTALPLLKVVLTHEDSIAYDYELLKNITVSKIEIEVKVGLNAADAVIHEGLKNLSLSNDIGVLDPSKPFLPFGPAPKKNDSFIIGNHELLKKKNAKLFFNVVWKDLPINSSDIDFNAVGAIAPGVNFYALQQGTWLPLGNPDVPIITGSSETPVTFPGSLLSLPDAVMLDYNQSYKPFDITASKGFVKLSLTDSFGHEDYQKALTGHLIALANGSEGLEEAPNEPYTPRIQKLSIHYKASTIINISDASSFENRSVQFFHVYPFGEAEQHEKLSAVTRLLPQFRSADGHTHNEGEFYIALNELMPGQSVSILFQMLEGTSNPLLEKPDDHVRWSYLSNNQWKPFDDRALTDATSQLVRSGIISFIIPTDATNDNSLLPPGPIWIRASVAAKSEAVCKLLDVLAQAAVVNYVDENSATDFLDRPLPAGTISKLREPSSAVKKIEQPYASFGGRANETNETFYVRVSERLKHKARAVTIWDYEHLILEEFPDIHRVKCLNHTRYEGNDYNEIAPGHVTIITIPNLINRNDANPLRPYTSQDVLASIHDFIKAKLSCHVKLHVRHPQFEEVRMEFQLKLVSGLEFNYYHDLLKHEITSFLTPWAYGRAIDVEFGGKVHKSVLINFIEERDYVDYITDVKMYHRVDESLTIESADTDIIEASTARSILVSAPAKKHKIYELSESPSAVVPEDCVDEYNSGA
jgi:hypothetical protein